MSSFNSLTLACDGWFDKALAELPEALRDRLEDEFWPMPWDMLSAQGRREVCSQIDFDADPATQSIRLLRWEYAEAKFAIEDQIKKWEMVTTPTAIDLRTQELQLAELQTQLASLHTRFGMGDGAPAPQSLGNEPQTSHQALPESTSTTKVGTSARDVRKFQTVERHKRWQKEYQKSVRKNPGKSDVWHSERLAKAEVGDCSPETIRKNMKRAK
jgi:hypothetical protein